MKRESGHKHHRPLNHSSLHFHNGYCLIFPEPTIVSCVKVSVLKFRPRFLYAENKTPLEKLKSIMFVSDKEPQIGHKPTNAFKDGRVPLVSWEPFFCVLLQDEQTLTAYRSEELSVSINNQ